MFPFFSVPFFSHLEINGAKAREKVREYRGRRCVWSGQFFFEERCNRERKLVVGSDFFLIFCKFLFRPLSCFSLLFVRRRARLSRTMYKQMSTREIAVTLYSESILVPSF